MTPEEAIQTIRNTVIRLGRINVKSKFYKALETAVKALRQQIKKKPLYIDGDYGLPLCPVCKLSVDKNEDINYCSVCGQALDWSDAK